MKYFSRLKGLLAGILTAAGVAMVSAPQASAFTYTFDSTSRSVNSGSVATGASATVEFDFVDVGSGQVQLNLDFVNTTGSLSPFGAGATSSKLTGVAFDLFNDVTVDSFALNGKLDTFKTNVAFRPFSNQVGRFDIAFADNNNFVGGNAGGALSAGESSSATLVLSAPQEATVLRERFRSAFEGEGLNIAARFQRVNVPGTRSDKLLGGSVDPFEPPAKDIPEPAALGGLGLLLGFLKLRRK